MMRLLEDFGDYAFSEDASLKRQLCTIAAVLPALILAGLMLVPLFCYYTIRRVLGSKTLNTDTHTYLNLEDDSRSYTVNHGEYDNNIHMNADEFKEAIDNFEKQRQFKKDLDKTLK